MLDEHTAQSTAQSAADARTGSSIEVVPERRPDGFGFHFKIPTTGRMYRFEPARDPRQPRYWCFRICRCLPGGLIDVTERPWLGAFGMTRDDIRAASEAIRADPNLWLETQQLRQLRHWLLEEDHKPGGDAGSST